LGNAGFAWILPSDKGDFSQEYCEYFKKNYQSMAVKGWERRRFPRCWTGSYIFVCAEIPAKRKSLRPSERTNARGTTFVPAWNRRTLCGR